MVLPCLSEQWRTDTRYAAVAAGLDLRGFDEITNLLLERPNLNSTHLFRADILYDSQGVLQNIQEKTQKHDAEFKSNVIGEDKHETVSCEARASPNFDGFRTSRTVLRRLIPRKPQLDKPLEQTCHIYDREADNGKSDRLVVYLPHVSIPEDIPWYHPPVKALAYLYQEQGSRLSVHFLPFSEDSISVPQRLHRTFLSLLGTIIRLGKHKSSSQADGEHTKDYVDAKKAHPQAGHEPTTVRQVADRSTAPSALKDTILPQHIVQDTYTRLKQQYASDLINRWVEKTEPSKHVFEDLSIAAFLIELWKQMYVKEHFPGFVDIACGNGVLVYILLKEGYKGYGFDARRRKTWEVLGIDEYLEEKLCIPAPFLDAIGQTSTDVLPGTTVHAGLLRPGTFIISNHADELTPWTPILAALSSPTSPLPFLAIPCCSHALSGARHRYNLKDIQSSPQAITDAEEQSAAGDLKALRAAKQKAASHTDDKSMYACLTKKVVALAEELGFDVEMTLMRIPSTRNIGIVGNRRKAAAATGTGAQMESLSLGNDDTLQTELDALLRRECSISGGVEAAARTWIERAQKLQTGQGRGKVNLKGKQEHASA